MSLTKPLATLTSAAVLLAATACAKHTEAAATPPPTMLTAANKAAAAAVARRLVEQDRENERAHREQMDKLVDAAVAGSRDSDRTISLLVRIHNKSGKAIRLFDAGLEVDTKAPARRVGLAEMEAVKTIAPHATVSFWYPMRYLRFGEDAGTMRLAQGKPKHISLEVTEIKYADGSDAGYDD